MSRICLQRSTSAAAPERGSPPGPGVTRRGFRSLAEFASDTAGDVAMMFGIMAITMFMFIGAAVDLGRWLNARDQTLAAIDAAVLAGGRALQTNGGNMSAAIAVAQKYYDQNIKGRLPVNDDTVVFSVTQNGTAVTATGTANIATPFMSLAGIKTLPILNSAGTEQPTAVLAVGGNAELNLEITMMLDTSGSMGEYTSSGNAKYVDMRSAASDLVNIVVWQDQSKFTSRVGIVPFSGDVRVPSSMLSQVTNPSAANTITKTVSRNSYTYKKTACVAERTGTNKYTDVAPGSGNYVLNSYTSNGTCAQSQTSDELLPMTNDKTALTSKINGLVPRGTTAGHVGTAWAWYLLSPNWANVLPSTAAPSAYGAANTKKIAILMTDGEYNSEHDSSGIAVGSNGAGNSANGTDSSTQAVSVCTAMKAKGIEIYTVGFNVSDNSTAVSTLSSCATDATKFYDAADGEQLKQAFRDIALKISSLYLAK